MVENRLNEERLIFVQEEIVRPMAIAVCDKQRVFETERKATHEAIAADATTSEGDRKVANAIVASASAKLEALSLINSDINRYFETFIKPPDPFNVADAFDKTALIAPRDDTDRSNNKSRMRIANGFAKSSGALSKLWTTLRAAPSLGTRNRSLVRGFVNLSGSRRHRPYSRRNG